MAVIGTIAGTIGAISLDAIGQIALFGGLIEGGKQLVDGLFNKVQPKTSAGADMTREEFGSVEVPAASFAAAVAACGEAGAIAILTGPGKASASPSGTISVAQAIQTYEAAWSVFIGEVIAATVAGGPSGADQIIALMQAQKKLDAATDDFQAAIAAAV